jgi:peptidylprolyl isomerase
MKRFLAAGIAALVLVLIVAAVAIFLTPGRDTDLPPTKDTDLENMLYMDLKFGRVVIEMRPDLAPKHVARIKELVKQGFYNGVPFHRVIAGFMAQTGDPTGTGMGGSGQNLPAEFNKEPHVRGTVSMARAQSPNSADSQFFICFDDATFLDGQYTVWGKVVEGMEFVDMIKKGDDADNGSVPENVRDVIVKMTLAADAK